MQNLEAFSIANIYQFDSEGMLVAGDQYSVMVEDEFPAFFIDNLGRIFSQ
jgi:hypothetical protein